METCNNLDNLIFNSGIEMDEYALLATFVVCRRMYQNEELANVLRKAAKLADDSDIATVAKIARYAKDKEALITCLLRAPVGVAREVADYLVEIASDDKAVKDRLLHLILSSASDLSFASLSAQKYLRPAIRTLIRMDKSYAARLLKMALDGELNKYARCLVLSQFKGEKILSCALDVLRSEQDTRVATLLFDVILRNMENASKYEQQLLQEAHRFMMTDSEYTRMQATMVALCFDNCNEFIFSSVIKEPQVAASALVWAVAWQLPVGKDNLKSMIDIIIRNENDQSVRRALPFARMLNGDIKGSAFCGEHTVTEYVMLETLDDAIEGDRRMLDECVSCS